MHRPKKAITQNYSKSLPKQDLPELSVRRTVAVGKLPRHEYWKSCHVSQESAVRDSRIKWEAGYQVADSPVFVKVRRMESGLAAPPNSE